MSRVSEGDEFMLVTRTRAETKGSPDVVTIKGRARVTRVLLFSVEVESVPAAGSGVNLGHFMWEPGNKHHGKQHGVAPDFALWLAKDAELGASDAS